MRKQVLVPVILGILFFWLYQSFSFSFDLSAYDIGGTSLSELEKQREYLSTLAKRVEIIRDDFGIPHIFGDLNSDVAFGLAYAHAEDDFLNIQRMYLTAKGRLSAVYGRSQIPADYLNWLFRVNERVEKYWEGQYSEKAKSIAKGYFDGLHYFALTHPEQLITNRADLLFPLDLKDSARFFAILTPIFANFQEQISIIMEEDPYYAVSMGSRPAEEPTEQIGEIIGSNAFAVAPDRTADGSTLLAINPHQAWEGMTSWYEVNLHSKEGWNITGALFAGSPVVIQGHNEHLGWAHTVNKPDILDMYLLKTDPTKPGKYYYDGKWVDFEDKMVPIEVKWKGIIQYTEYRMARWCIYGPVFERPHGTYAIRWAGVSGGSFKKVGLLDQWLQMNFAKTMEEWKSSFSLSMIPMFNSIFADKQGNILFKYNALLPIRDPTYLWRNVLVDGTTSRTFWSEYFPTEQLPEVLNPTSGFLQNCNNSPWNTTAISTHNENPTKTEWAFSLGIDDKLMTNRAIRALELLSEREKITWEDFKRIKYDSKYSNQSDIYTFFQRFLDEIEFDTKIQDNKLLSEAYEMLRAWDYSTDVSNPTTALAVLTFSPFVKLNSWLNYPLDSLNAGTLYQVRNHFIQNVYELSAIYHNISVPWGTVNRIMRGNQQFAISGAPDVLHTVTGVANRNGQIIASGGDSYILLVKWDSEGRVHSEAISPFGASLYNPNSKHFNDQTELFASNQLRKVRFYREDLQEFTSYTPYTAPTCN